MSSFRDQNWEARFSQMGDEAEGHFEQYAEGVLGQKWIRFGLERPPLHMASLPTRLRYTPDYLMSKRFVEVQGFGRDQTFKIKHDKLNCLHWWNDLHPLHVYVWDSHKKRECMVHLFEIDRLIDGGKAELGHFHEGKAYFALRAEDIFEAATP
jgi:hypothetical protein